MHFCGKFHQCKWILILPWNVSDYERNIFYSIGPAFAFFSRQTFKLSNCDIEYFRFLKFLYIFAQN